MLTTSTLYFNLQSAMCNNADDILMRLNLHQMYSHDFSTVVDYYSVSLLLNIYTLKFIYYTYTILGVALSLFYKIYTVLEAFYALYGVCTGLVLSHIVHKLLLPQLEVLI